MLSTPISSPRIPLTRRFSDPDRAPSGGGGLLPYLASRQTATQVSKLKRRRTRLVFFLSALAFLSLFFFDPFASDEPPDPDGTDTGAVDGTVAALPTSGGRWQGWQRGRDRPATVSS